MGRKRCLLARVSPCNLSHQLGAADVMDLRTFIEHRSILGAAVPWPIAA
jgi:hypothetical protein